MEDQGLIRSNQSRPIAHYENSNGSLIRDLDVVEVSPEEVPHLLDYYAIVMKRRWVVFTCLLVVFTTAAIATFKQRPVFRGQVTVEIDPEPPSVVNFKEIVNISPVDVDSYRETQYKILASRSLAERVINDLQLYHLPEFYRSRSLFGLFQSNPKRLPSPSDPTPPDSTLDYYRNSVKYLEDNVSIEPVRRSNLVHVSFDSYDPKLAARVANQLAEDYIQITLDAKWDETNEASKWLSGRLDELKGKLEKSDDALQAYAQSHSILFINGKNGDQNTANMRLEELLQDLTDAQADRIKMQAQYSLVEKGKLQDLPGVLDNRLIQNLEDRKAGLEKDYATVTAFVKPDYPKARQVQRQIDALQKQINEQKAAILQNIADNFKAAKNREDYLRTAVNDQRKVVDDINRKSIQYNILKREADSNRQLYDGLLERMKEAQVSSTSRASNIHIVDSAEVPAHPVKPRVPLNLALGIFLGAGLGIGLAFFQEYLDKTLKTSDDVERLLRLPSLGVLPRYAIHSNGKDSKESVGLVPAGNNGHQELAPTIRTDAESVEAFRSLRTSLLLSASPVPKLLLVTSALPSEGKTTTAMNLGAALAGLGNRVVIVDCDMRRPACHRAAGVENKPGFVQCLTGHVDLSKAILKVPGVNSLSVIPCGPIPPNPAEVLSSQLTGELLHKLKAQFDFVLVDSPPILSVADSRILATMTDAAILVSRAHSTPFDVVRRARSLLYGAGSRILGVALNGVDFKREGYGYMAGGYGTTYGYSYTAAPHAQGDTPQAQ